MDVEATADEGLVFPCDTCIVGNLVKGEDLVLDRKVFKTKAGMVAISRDTLDIHELQCFQGLGSHQRSKIHKKRVRFVNRTSKGQYAVKRAATRVFFTNRGQLHRVSSSDSMHK